MRLFVTLALATSAVVALNQPRQDSPVLLDHQQIRMDTADNELRVLQGGRDVKHAKRSLRGQDVPTASYDSSARRLSSAGLFSCCFKGQSSGRAAANNPAAIGRQNSMTEANDEISRLSIKFHLRIVKIADKGELKVKRVLLVKVVVGPRDKRSVQPS
ncbi:unnamed protein product [Aphanomyces euteiches]